MNERPASFLEFPEIEINVPYDFNDRSPHSKRPELSRVLLAQSVDHAFCLLLGAFLAATSFSLFSNSISRVINEASAFFWVAQFTTLGALGALYRIFFILLDGATPGQNLVGIQVRRLGIPSWNFWLRQLLEACQLIFPILWLVDALSRKVGSELGVHYKSLR
jgi:hypothetical protein